MTAPMRADWHLRGEWFDVCSCSLSCPCRFAHAPTHGDRVGYPYRERRPAGKSGADDTRKKNDDHAN